MLLKLSRVASLSDTVIIPCRHCHRQAPVWMDHSPANQTLRKLLKRWSRYATQLGLGTDKRPCKHLFSYGTHNNFIGLFSDLQHQWTVIVWIPILHSPQLETLRANSNFSDFYLHRERCFEHQVSSRVVFFSAKDYLFKFRTCSQ